MNVTIDDFVQARNYTRANRAASDIWWIVLHDMEAAEKTGTAEAVAEMFRTTTRQASAHYNVDVDSIIQSVKDKDVAWAAKNANRHGLHIEHAGFASQSRGDWTDSYSRAMLARSAKLVAAKCLEYNIPVVRLGVEDLQAGRKGLTDHATVSKWSEKYGLGSSGHYDPGPNFPWDVYLAMVKAEVDALKGKPKTKSQIRRIAAAVGVVAAIFAGITQIPDPAPAPKPTPTATATAKPTGTPGVKTPTPTPSKTVKPTAKPTLRVPFRGEVGPGDYNAKVGRIQSRLKTLGYYKGRVDRDFGPKTKAAVIAFQKANKIKADGYVGPVTWRALFTY